MSGSIAGTRGRSATTGSIQHGTAVVAHRRRRSVADPDPASPAALACPELPRRRSESEVDARTRSTRQGRRRRWMERLRSDAGVRVARAMAILPRVRPTIVLRYGAVMPALPVLPPDTSDALAKALDKTMSGSEMTPLLARHGIDDPLGPQATKWRRLSAAFELRQSRDRCANAILAFTASALAPARFIGKVAEHAAALDAVNHVLVLVGLAINERCELRLVDAAHTVAEAEERAGRLRGELRRRRVHGDVLRYCKAELLEENYFHAVLEATKSVASKLREKSGLSSDGNELVESACGLGKTGVPLVAFNALTTDSEQSEHKGIASLLRGMFGTFRNPAAHAPKIDWEVTEDDALDLLTLASFLHRRLDAAARTHRAT